MLFLHALLFSLLATSTLAIPVPTEENQASTNPPLVNGLWYLLGCRTSFHVVAISDGKLAEVIWPVPSDGEDETKFFREIFPKRGNVLFPIRWQRIKDMEGYKLKVGEEVRKTRLPPNFETLNPENGGDELSMNFDSEKKYLDITLYAYVDNRFETPCHDIRVVVPKYSKEIIQ